MNGHLDPEIRTRPTAITIIAILNICFGLLCCLQNSGTAIMPLYFGMIQGVMAEVENMQEAEREEISQHYNERIEVAADEAEVAELTTQRDMALMRLPNMKMSEMYSSFQSPSATAYFISDGLLSMLGNILLVVSGIGLLLMKPWARKLALYVAGYKILLAAVMAVWYGFGIIPGMMESMEEMVKAQQAQMNALRTARGAGGPAPPGPPQGLFTKIGYGMGAVGAVFYFMFSALYPVTMLLVLTRPTVREAFEE